MTPPLQNSIEVAITRAIDGGYRPYNDRNAYHLRDTLEHQPNNSFCLDPKFWECLGKSEGWEGKTNEYMTVKFLEIWQYRMHSFIDALIEGKTAEEYFKSILSK